MRQSLIPQLLMVSALLLLSGCGVNNLPTLDEGVKAAWSQVQNQYQRRADLIPNLVATVKGYAAQERETLLAVTEARAKVGSMQVDPSLIDDPGRLQQFEQAQSKLSGALSRLMVVVEKYPDLNVELMLEERVLDLPMREADVAIRMKEPSQADLVRRRLMNVNMRLYASDAYFENRRMPADFEALRNHRIISQSLTAHQVSASLNWMRPLLSGEHGSHLTVNNYFGVLQAVLFGVGIGVLPSYVTADFPHLIRVLPEEESSQVPVYLAYQKS